MYTMNEMPLVSVIVPVHNAQDYIKHCLRSIIKQTYSNVEIIVVDDASTDESRKVIRKCLIGNMRLVALDDNVGEGRARFKGLSFCSGTYVMFVDADDFLPKDAIGSLVNAAVRLNADIVEGTSLRTLDSWGLLSRKSCVNPLTIVQPELFDKYYISFFGINILSVTMWGKLYRRSLFDHEEIKPSGLKIGEDLWVNMVMFPFIERYVRINQMVYYYRYGGVTARYNPRLWSDFKWLYFQKKLLIEKYHYIKAANSIKIEMCNVFHSTILLMVTFNVGFSDIEAFIDNEIQSGFLDEITSGINSNRAHFKFILDKDKNGLIELCKSEAKGVKMRRLLMRILSSVLQ
jgi:glycosyltransferase involved in cell wall biosynthesis